jgi:hypothetical protein
VQFGLGKFSGQRVLLVLNDLHDHGFLHAAQLARYEEATTRPS